MPDRFARLLLVPFAVLAATLIAASCPSLAQEQELGDHDSITDGELPVKVELAYDGKRFDRPVFLTHAGDGSNRLFVVGQRGTIHILEDKEDATPKLFLNIREKIRYSDRENEEGLLGLAFHPNYHENGQFFIYYSTREYEPQNNHVSIISRMRVSADDPNKADPQSEEVIMTIDQPFWNHNGGTIVFGPDKYLYVGLGDGGAANDPYGNGQNLGTLLGSISRIDVDNKQGELAYAIPEDNPFVDKEGARGEIWAYGIRNVWRIAFDRETGELWAGDVGQNIWEEVDIIKKGGNYGWNKREGMHPFGDNGATTSEGFQEPIFEYQHTETKFKSITGGTVYRGKNVPQLVGKYIFADYVSGDLCALDVDHQTEQVKANYGIEWAKLPVMTFGETEQGEVLFTTTFGQIYRFVPAE